MEALSSVRVLTLWYLDEWALEDITSRLNFFDLSCLLRACNRVLRYKLLRNGGIRSLQLVASSYRDEVHNSNSLVPRVVLSKRTLLDNYKRYPSTLFPNLRRLMFAPRTLDWNPPSLNSLPTTLTHLDWESAGDNTTIEVLKCSKLADVLPNLQFLSLIVGQSMNRPVPKFSASALIEGLPQGIKTISLSLPVLDELMFKLFSKLPSGVTQLAYQPICGTIPTTLSASHFAVALPESITDLRLPHFQFKITSDIKEFGWTLKLERLHLHYVSADARPLLPPSLTWLGMRQMLCTREEVMHERWPPKLETLDIVLHEPLMSLFPPSTTRIKNDYYTSSTIRLAIQLNLTEHIIYAEFPRLVLYESCLIAMPKKLQKLIIWDICLDGTSIPDTATSIDDESIKQYFWAARRSASFSTFLLHNRPLQKKRYPVILSGNLLSLNITGHHLGLNSLPLSLTRALHVEIPVLDKMERFELPPNLTHLGLEVNEGSPSMKFETLLKLAPNLTHVSGGRFVLDQDCLPYEPLDNNFIIEEGYDEDKECDSGILLLPEDAEQVFLSRYPHITFEDTQFDTGSLLSNCSKPFTAYRACRLVGSFHNVSRFFLRHGLQNLIRIEIMGRLSGKDADIDAFPKLPDTLTELIAGPPLSFAYLQCFYPWKRWRNLPNLKRITLYFPWFHMNMNAPWELPNIPTLTELNLHMNSQYFSIKDLPTHMDRIFTEEQLLSASSNGVGASTSVGATSRPDSDSSSSPYDSISSSDDDSGSNVNMQVSSPKNGNPTSSSATTPVSKTKCNVM